MIFLRGHIKYKVSILDKHRNRFIQAHLFLKKSNVRQAKFRINKHVDLCYLILSAISVHSYNWTREQDIHIAHIEDSGQTALQ